MGVVVFFRPVYSDRLEVEDGRIVRTVVASWNATKKHEAGSVEVYRIDDEARQYTAHLVFNCYTGYLVDGGDVDEEYWAEPVMKLAAFRNGNSEPLTKHDRDLIEMVYPDFLYTIDKAQGRLFRADVMNLLIAWKKNPKVELLVGAGLDCLKLNKTFARMTATRQRQVLAYIQKTPGAKFWSLNKILFVLNRKGSPQDFDRWQDFKHGHKLVGFELWKKYGEDHALYDLYGDYVRVAKLCGHDMRDPYWKLPKDVKAAHDKVMEEYRRIEEARRLEQRKAKSCKDRETRRKFEAISEKLKKFVLRNSGLVAYVPKDIKCIREQAAKLHQCLVFAGYIDKMATGRCCLVFIKDRGGKPIATAEIMPNGKVGQFYGDEKGRIIEKMKPSKKCRDVLDKWMDKFAKPTKKAMREAA